MSSVKQDYKNLAERLISIYALNTLEQAKKAPRDMMSYRLRKLPQNARQLYETILGMSNIMDKYKDPLDMNTVLDTIDLALIYENVDKRERENGPHLELQYDDLVVKELLHYFKNSFFKWVNKPECPLCHSESNVVGLGGSRFSGSLNPDQVSVVENYQCRECNSRIQFPRVNNPVSLLKTRRGRCGEWVNCFTLILRAMIAEDRDRVRYVWNMEDHVWCEYYSYGLKRWVHLDPCEAVFDEPLLYCNNWNKKMSFVIGYNDNYIIDLSSKYITDSNQIDKSTIIPSLKQLLRFINAINCNKLLRYYKCLDTASQDEKLTKCYNDVIVVLNRELLQLKDHKVTPTMTQELPKGRQTGSSEWTKERGEDGN